MSFSVSLFKALIDQGSQDDVSILRNVAYFLALMSEGGYENHPFIVEEGGLSTLVRLMSADDVEIVTPRRSSDYPANFFR